MEHDIEKLKRALAPEVKIEGILKAQLIAKTAVGLLPGLLRPGMTAREICALLENAMLELGSGPSWSKGGALVLFGPLTAYSAHESPYALFDTLGLKLPENGMITADVAPTFEGGWGDFTRAFFLKDGKCVPAGMTGVEEYERGMKLEEKLHAAAVDFVDESTTFEQLHAHINAIIEKEGWVNLDYHQNFGHTIENLSADRVQIAAGESRCIAEYARPIAFEPHIAALPDKTNGFKHEDVYVFLEGRLEKL